MGIWIHRNNGQKGSVRPFKLTACIQMVIKFQLVLSLLNKKLEYEYSVFSWKVLIWSYKNAKNPLPPLVEYQSTPCFTSLLAIISILLKIWVCLALPPVTPSAMSFFTCLWILLYQPTFSVWVFMHYNHIIFSPSFLKSHLRQFSQEFHWFVLFLALQLLATFFNSLELSCTFLKIHALKLSHYSKVSLVRCIYTLHYRKEGQEMSLNTNHPPWWLIPFLPLFSSAPNSSFQDKPATEKILSIMDVN